MAPRHVFDQTHKRVVTWQDAADAFFNHTRRFFKAGRSRTPPPRRRAAAAAGRRSGAKPEAHPELEPEPEPELESEAEARRADFKLTMALRHFTTWNGFVEQVAARRVRVEDVGPATVAWLCAALPELWPAGCPTPEAVRAAAAALGQDVNHGHVKVRPGLSTAEVTWARLAALDRPSAALAQGMALRYGYNVSALELLPEASARTTYGFTAFGQWYYRLSKAPT